MISKIQKAIIVKDIKGITGNKRLFSVMLIVPLVMTVFVPSMFIFSLKFAPESVSGFEQIIKLLPDSDMSGVSAEKIIGYIINNIMPMFFLLIPIMSASVMAASSFVGEKEKQTLETLLYSPITLKGVFQAKILASFLLSMAVSFLSLIIMVLVVEIEVFFLMGSFLVFDFSWLMVMLLVSPAISLIAIILIVHNSAKAETVEEVQQRAAFLVLPIILLVAGQFMGAMLLSPLLLLGIGAVLVVIAVILLKRLVKNLSYEIILK